MREECVLELGWLESDLRRDGECNEVSKDGKISSQRSSQRREEERGGM
jgi:hypothetical protein